MKRLFLTIILSIIFSCNSTQLTEQWKNPDIENYSPKKIFIIGLTSNIEAREKFENQIKNQLELRHIESVSSLEFLDPQFRTEMMTKIQFMNLELDLIEAGFDTILFSKVIGVEDKIVYRQNYKKHHETNINFSEDYLKYQDQFYNPNDYNEYQIYNAETTMFCICPNKEHSIVWKGYVSITDPRSIEKTVNEYVNLVIAVLENQKLIDATETTK
ncbi:hypothetical protein [uncultured Winogradskyella sp.]|uniref:hypothetical protein n=1 Tax=Winogradskyella sp. 4-2091 TaxID=3381659 RepID=UPI002612D744|nr:hypothetical protein [uncultured Winogradskyella sp.]